MTDSNFLQCLFSNKMDTSEIKDLQSDSGQLCAQVVRNMAHLIHTKPFFRQMLLPTQLSTFKPFKGCFCYFPSPGTLIGISGKGDLTGFQKPLGLGLLSSNSCVISPPKIGVSNGKRSRSNNCACLQHAWVHLYIWIHCTH